MTKNKLLSELKYQLCRGLPTFMVIFFTGWMPDIGVVTRFRGALVSFFLPGKPKGLALGRDVTLLAVDRLHLGNNVYIAKGSWLNAIGTINISDEVVIAPYVVMSSNNHGFKEGSVRYGGAHPAPIKIGKGTWLATHVVVTAGVTVGRGNLVGANSVVTKSSSDNVVLAGVPAKEVSKRIDNPSLINSKHDIEV